jgi:hypothetical protein
VGEPGDASRPQRLAIAAAETGHSDGGHRGFAGVVQQGHEQNEQLLDLSRRHPWP